MRDDDAMRSRRERRRIRRSSPDAPQGLVPVIVVCVGLGVVVAILSMGLERTPTRAETPSGTVLVNGKSVRKGEVGTSAPTTVVISGAQTTNVFVTTTTPITTTSSTTTTLPSRALLTFSRTLIRLDASNRTATVLVQSAWPKDVGFFLDNVPAGISVSPTFGQARKGHSVKLAIRLVDPSIARSGELKLIAANGSSIPLTIEVASPQQNIGQVVFTPVQPVCNQPVIVRVPALSGSVTSMTLHVDQVLGSAFPMTIALDGSWSAVVTAPKSQIMSGTITVTDGAQLTTSKIFSVALAGGPMCID